MAAYRELGREELLELKEELEAQFAEVKAKRTQVRYVKREAVKGAVRSFYGNDGRINK